MNLLHENIDVHSIRLIAKFPGYVVKYISNLQSHFANMTFSEKSRYDRILKRVKKKNVNKQ